MAVNNSDMPEGVPDTQPQASGPAPIQQGSMGHAVFYDKLRQAQGKIGVVQNVLGKLLGMGDMVSPEDVIKGASKIVAAGVSPEGMAAMLADMPEKQELLAPWLQQHKDMFDQQAQQLNSLTGSVRHAMGAEAMQQLGAQSQGPAPAAQNALGLASQGGGAAPSNPLAME